jgi:Ca2+-binding EF-hand superfamily protein
VDEYEMFERASGFELNPVHFDQLCLYVSVSDEKDVIEQIEWMSEFYDNPNDAEVGFVVLYHFLNKIKN